MGWKFSKIMMSGRSMTHLMIRRNVMSSCVKEREQKRSRINFVIRRSCIEQEGEKVAGKGRRS